MRWKEEFIARYGEAVYKKMLARTKANGVEYSRKGGKYYQKTLMYNQTGLQGERNKVRGKHGREWRPYKNIIAPESQLHHEWISGIADYRGLALVEAEQHMHGFVDVIEILEGKITLFTENEVREREAI